MTRDDGQCYAEANGEAIREEGGNEENQMTNEQLYMSIGIPMLFNGVCMLLLSNRITSVESRIASIETRMLSLESTMTARFDLLMGRLTDLEKELHKR